MSYTEKYNFKVSINQFHLPVPSNFFDTEEVVLIEAFEQACVNLKNLNKPKYSMIELGSNQCYYSLLFKHILGKDKTFNIMVEPVLANYEAGIQEFKLNECTGLFYNKCIGNKSIAHNKEFKVPSVTLNEILLDANIDKVDIMQCDIDCSEHYMLESNLDFFKEHKTEFLFLGTHSLDLHINCKNILESLKYTILMDHPISNVGSDSLLIAQYINS